MTRIQKLREAALSASHKCARIEMDPNWNTKEMELSLPERKACALALLLENMPPYIGDNELVVGSRTIYGSFGENSRDQSNMGFCAMPDYINRSDIEFFGFDGGKISKGHYAADYGIILEIGVGGVIARAEAKLAEFAKAGDISSGQPDKIDFLNSVIIAYRAFSAFISNYADHAKKLASSASGARIGELGEIASTCGSIAWDPPKNYREAVQLFWFAHLGLLAENYIFMNYGRIDQFLYPYLETCPEAEARELTACLLVKMYDMADMYGGGMDRYGGQHNITIGGQKREGGDAANRLTFMILDAAAEIRLPEPEISIRIHKNSPPLLLGRACELSVQGLNYIAYYNDDVFVNSMIAAGVAPEDARDYSFDLCQDVTVAGRGDYYSSCMVSLTWELLQHLNFCEDGISYEKFFGGYKKRIIAAVSAAIENYNNWESAVLDFNRGEKQTFVRGAKSGAIARDYCGQSIMSPLPLTSALFHGCLENAVDLTRLGNVLEHKGAMIMAPVIAINSLAAIKKCVFEEKIYTLAEVKEACSKNFEGFEKMRQKLWNSPKWGNDDDYADLIGKEIIEAACEEMSKHKTPRGGAHLSGIHQPHPVPTGAATPATPEGRLAGTPIPVTLTPENGTMKNGPTAAFLSALKIDPKYIQWNNCLMLQYFSSSFETAGGAKVFERLVREYFSAGGSQHQPNIASLEDLKHARSEPEKYRDLTVRLWGVSARFVTLSREMQDEFIARFEGI
ncbi:MAG: hypothetical protein FWG34_05830 [Oscillospiraceae bacterium]|nr:hypothetical protein [Oscillospiraceae bacterium]